MKSRVAGIVSTATKGKCATITGAGTFHAIANRLLRIYARRVGFDPNFTVLDRGDAAQLMGQSRKALGYDKLPKRFPSKEVCLDIYSYKVNAYQPLKEILSSRFEEHKRWRKKLSKLFDDYVAAKQRSNVLDFDDLLLYWAELLAAPGLGRRICTMFDHVLVDEFQDTCALQSLILKRLKPEGRGLTVVGDDAQAIYSFRAADARIILEFPEQFSPPATIIKLERNYRSTKPILAASNAVINASRSGFTKTMHTTRKGGDKPVLVTVDDEQAQATYVADQVTERLEDGRQLNQQAVLFRASHHSAALEIELNVRGIPFVKFGGGKFMEAAHIKDVLGVLRWFENPADMIAGGRTLALLPGVGAATAQKLLAEIGTRDIATVMKAMPIPAKAAALWRDLAKLAPDEAPWAGQLEAVCRWYNPVLEAIYDDGLARRTDLEQLQVIAANYATRRAFLTELTLDPPSKSKVVNNKDTEDDVLTLPTIHSVKGREWQTVTVLNATDGSIPSSRAETTDQIEEERRLLYVAMTRAKTELTLVLPWRTRSYTGQHDAVNRRCRFITDDMLPLFEQQAWHNAGEGNTAADNDATSEVRFDLMARVRAALIDA